MKLSSLIAGTALLLFSSFSAASADEVNYSGSSVNMGQASVGQFGTISNIYDALFLLPPNVVGSGETFGFLPHNAKITFSYTLDGLVDGQLQGYSTYDHHIGGDHYQGSALADSDGTYSSSGSINGSPSASLVMSTANLNLGDPSTGTVTITNTSGAFAAFQSLFFGVLNAANNSGSINYAVSAVPLPAALPMFAALLAGMFGFKNRRKHAVAAA